MNVPNKIVESIVQSMKSSQQLGEKPLVMKLVLRMIGDRNDIVKPMSDACVSKQFTF